MLNEVGRRNPFYRRRWEEHGLELPPRVGELEDLRRLPLTTKRDLVEDQIAHPPFGTVLTYPLERYVRFHQTSGTTGAPIRWLDTPESWEWWIRCWTYVLRAAGVGAADRVLFAFSFGPFVGFWSGFEAAWRLGALAIPGGGQDSVLRLRTLVDSRATVLVCTPSYALHLAGVAREQGLDPAATSIRTTIHAGEPGASVPGTRRRIEEAWGATCFDHYGLTEVGALSFQCRERPDALHVNDAEFVVEVLDPRTGEAAWEGEGELVVTNLGRPCSPVIRYRTGDLVRLVRDRCECGRTFGRLEGGVRGRVDDMLVVRGMNVFPSAIEDVVRRHPLVEEFRIEVFKRGEMDQVRLLLEPVEGLGDEAAARQAAEVAEDLRRHLGIRVETAAVPPGTLPRFELKAKRLVRLSEAP
jgi:phenylacetate-CoA ligase